jgi:CBS domain containing-hemolysin-like protein
MTLSSSLLLIGLLIAASAFFSMAEIALAAARRLRLRQLADEGDARAERVLRVQDQPGDYFTVVQIGQNAVAILGGVVGEGALSPHFSALLAWWLPTSTAQTLGFLASFTVITSLFILFSDLFPKRLGMARPEELAMRLSGPMAWCHDGSRRARGGAGCGRATGHHQRVRAGHPHRLQRHVAA